MLKEVRFLIIVPTYNSSRILGRLVKSLKNQTFQNWKTIFVDAYSDKENEELLFKYIASDKRFLIQRENDQFKGIFPSMTLGAQYAKEGDWVVFLGSDDWLSSSFSLEKISKKIKENLNFDNNDTAIIFETHFLASGNNKLLRNNKIPAKGFINKKKLSNLLYFGYIPVHQSVCFSKRLLEKIMPYSNEYKLASDCDLFFRLLTINSLHLIVLDEALINIQSGGLSSRSFYKRIKEVILIYKKKYKNYFIFPLLLRYLRKVFLRIRNII